MVGQMHVSVAILTFNRAFVLRRTLLVYNRPQVVSGPVRGSGESKNGIIPLPRACSLPPEGVESIALRQRDAWAGVEMERRLERLQHDFNPMRIGEIFLASLA